MNDELEFAGYDWGVRWNESSEFGSGDEWHHCEFSARNTHTTFSHETTLIVRPVYRGPVEYVNRPALLLAASAGPGTDSRTASRERSPYRGPVIVHVEGRLTMPNAGAPWTR